ncbi:MAG: PAS domain S-box protein [Oceanipulchritudo sp.]
MDIEHHLRDPVFRALFEQTHEAVMIAGTDSPGILEANPRALQILGYSLDELRTLAVTDLSPDSQRAFLHDFIRATSGDGSERTLTTRLRSKYGEAVPCELNLRPLALGETGLLLFTFQDISERLQALHDIELRNVAIANVTSGVTIADARQPDLPLIYVNQGFQNVTGYSAREAVGRSCRFLQGNDRDQPPLDELRSALKEARPCVVQLRNYRKDGTLFHNELHISPVHNEEGELTHFVGIQLDVTEQVKARESLQRSEKRSREALAREKELNEIKTRFISMVSHEFRTPMTGIQASAALVRRFGDKLGPEKRVRHLENIEISLQRMNRLLDDVLFFSRAEADKLTVERTDLCLHDYFSRLMESLAPIHPGRDIHFHCTLGKSESFPLDEHLMDHIFQNLISNALKYSPPGSPVSCSVSRKNGDLVFSVRDQGIGIPATDQKRLFDAFHRADNVGARQGTGLGLNIARRATELLGGSITFDSQQDKGSTFFVHLPESPPEPSDQ